MSLTLAVAVDLIRGASAVFELVRREVAADDSLAADLKALHAEGKTFGTPEMDAAVATMVASRKLTDTDPLAPPAAATVEDTAVPSIDESVARTL